MDQFAVKVFVRLRPSVLDPAGEATKSASIKLGAEGIKSLRIGKMIEVKIEGNGENEVREKIDYCVIGYSQILLLKIMSIH